MSSAPAPFLFVNPRSLPSMNSSNLNVHHLSDVVVGTAVGLIAAAFVWRHLGKGKRQKAKRKNVERRSPVPSRTIRSLFSLHFAFCLFTFAFPRCPPRRRLSCSLIRGVYLR